MDKIARIRQEIERRSHGEQGFNSEDAEYGYRSCARDLLSFLDTLSEEPNTPEFPETFEICLYDGRTHNKENCNECLTTCSVRKEEPDKSLEEEIKKEMVKLPFFIRGKDQIAFARHFAEWGAEHLKK